jgi:hypothetical protein
MRMQIYFQNDKLKFLCLGVELMPHSLSIYRLGHLCLRSSPAQKKVEAGKKMIKGGPRMNLTKKQPNPVSGAGLPSPEPLIMPEVNEFYLFGCCLVVPEVGNI